MKKIYTAPSAERIALETEDILDISYTGNSSVLKDSDDNNASKSPAKDFGDVSLF